MIEVKELEYYLNLISKSPKEILDEKIFEKPFELDLNALVKDLYFEFEFKLEDWNSEKFDFDPKKENNYCRIVLLICFFLSDKSFKNLNLHFTKIKSLILSFKKISDLIPIKNFLYDMERKEEFIRLNLNSLGLILKNETIAKFQDRLKSIDSIERQNMFEESKKLRERARLLKEEMARKEAEEAASKMNRE